MPVPNISWYLDPPNHPPNSPTSQKAPAKRVLCFSNTNAPRPARSFCSTLASSCSGRDGVCSGAPAEGEAHALGDLSNALVAAVEVGLGGRGGMRPLRGRGRGGDAGGWTRLRDGENVVDV